MLMCKECDKELILSVEGNVQFDIVFVKEDTYISEKSKEDFFEQEFETCDEDALLVNMFSSAKNIPSGKIVVFCPTCGKVIDRVELSEMSFFIQPLEITAQTDHPIISLLADKAYYSEDKEKSTSSKSTSSTVKEPSFCPYCGEDEEVGCTCPYILKGSSEADDTRAWETLAASLRQSGFGESTQEEGKRRSRAAPAGLIRLNEGDK